MTQQPKDSMTHFLIELLVALLFAIVLPRCVRKWAGMAERSLQRILKTPLQSAVFVGMIACLVSAGVGAAFGIAVPRVHDEHSYLLAADTYAQGRLTNPTHSEWQHFETFHVIQTPTYISKYPPGQGLLLAFGQLIWHPILGVWLGVGLACGALCWMLAGCLPRGWAIYGGLTVAFHPGIQTWGQTYLNGCLALFGGCLTLGAALRLARGAQWQDGIVFGVGCAVLALSRMYEGAVFAALVTLPLAIGLVFRRKLLPALAGVLSVFALLFTFLLYDNFRVTGSAWKLPYVVHEETYGYTPLFVFQQPRTHIMYRHAVMQRFHQGQSFREYTLQQSTDGFLIAAKAKLIRFSTWIFSLPALWLGLMGVLVSFLPLWKKERTASNPTDATQSKETTENTETIQKTKAYSLLTTHCSLCLYFCGILFFVPAFLVTTWFFTHYAAPVFSLVFLLLFVGVRRVAAWRIRGRAVGRNWVRVMLLVSVGAFCLSAPRPYLGLPARQEVMAQLEKAGGRHLVLVRYKTSHNVHEEWVYNRADIDAAPVVWAREMGGENDDSLLRYFANRRVWLLEPDESPPRLRPFQSENIMPPPFFADILRRIPF
jgi:hypothetical protein